MLLASLNLPCLPCPAGIWVAQWINYGTQHMHPHGWRLSVGLAIVPALILFLGSLLLPDTPNSLAHRGHTKKARQVGGGPVLLLCAWPMQDRLP